MMKDKEHVEFIKAFENIVNSITLIDIPNQDGAISKEDFKKKLDNSKLNLKLSNGIEESIKSLSKNENTIILCVGSLYLAGEILSLNQIFSFIQEPISLFGTAPTLVETWFPSFIKIIVGIPLTPNFVGVFGSSSMLCFATDNWSDISFEISSKIGAIWTQGPHHEAQKSVISILFSLTN